MGTMASQPFIQAQIKENIEAPRHWPLSWNSPVTDEVPAQMASNAESVSIWWRHHTISDDEPDLRRYRALLSHNELKPRFAEINSEIVLVYV